MAYFFSGLYLDFTQIEVRPTIRLITSYFKGMLEYGGTNSYSNLMMDDQDVQIQVSQNAVEEKFLL